MTEATTRLAYRLEPKDLAQYLSKGRRGACRSQCSHWALSLLVLAPIVAALASGMARTGGIRSMVLALGAGAVFLVQIVAIREWIACRQSRTLAQRMGLPREVAVVVTPDGLVQEPDEDGIGRSYAWSDIEDISHQGSLTVVRLRVAGTAMLIPDRAFASSEDRQRLTQNVVDHSSPKVAMT